MTVITYLTHTQMTVDYFHTKLDNVNIYENLHNFILFL